MLNKKNPQLFHCGFLCINRAAAALQFFQNLNKFNAYLLRCTVLSVY